MKIWKMTRERLNNDDYADIENKNQCFEGGTLDIHVLHFSCMADTPMVLRYARWATLWWNELIIYDGDDAFFASIPLEGIPNAIRQMSEPHRQTSTLKAKHERLLGPTEATTTTHTGILLHQHTFTRKERLKTQPNL